MDKRRAYLKPSMRVLKLNQQQSLLAGSVKMQVSRGSLYGDPEEY